jgi:hypothetical protein
LGKSAETTRCPMLIADTLRDHLAAAFSCSEPEIDVGCTPSASDADPADGRQRGTVRR